MGAALAFTVSLEQQGLQRELVLVDAGVSALLLSAGIWTSRIIIQRYPTRVGLVAYAAFIGLLLGLTSWYLDGLILKIWYADRADYIRWFPSTQLTRLFVSLLATVWLATLAAMQKRTAVLEEQFTRTADAATLHKEAELYKLRQQLQPHFLYNSLNSITALIMIEPEKAQEMIGKLSDFLRSSVKREGKEIISIGEELESIEAYLSIESVRFGDRLNVVINKDIPEEAEIPPFLLQPILENAIKFGLYGRTGEVRIEMEIKKLDGELTITVRNPYDPGNRPPVGTGFGLEGIRRRLYLLFARMDLLETHTKDGIFITNLKIPQGYVQSDSDR